LSVRKVEVVPPRISTGDKSKSWPELLRIFILVMLTYCEECYKKNIGPRTVLVLVITQS